MVPFTECKNENKPYLLKYFAEYWHAIIRLKTCPIQYVCSRNQRNQYS